MAQNDTIVSDLIFNSMSQAEFNAQMQAETLDPNQFYLTPDTTQSQLNDKADIATVDAISSRVSTLEGYDYVVATQEPTSANGHTWFRKYKSGWVEQGGRAVIYNGNAEPNRYDTKDISIPVPMKHCTNWHCQAKHDRFNAGIRQDNITTTAHIYQVNDSANTFVNAFVIWEISGYAA